MRARSLLLLGTVAALALSAAGQTNSLTSSTVYLQNTSDRYQQTIDVYTDADAAGNHFAYRGEIDSSGGVIQVPAMDEISPNAPCHSGITCITATFNPTQLAWGGWYFLNGILKGHDRQPEPNWGTYPNAGYDLTGASSLRFWARGAVGGEQVSFFAFGVGWDPAQPYPDSSPKVSVGPITLTSTWAQYQIPIAGHDLHYVLGGFGWVAAAGTGQQNPINFYMDDVQYLKARPRDPRFLVSYETIKSDNPFDKVERNAGFTYDSAVAMIALLASGDVSHARTIANALLYAQLGDRFFNDYRLRNAYQGGDIKLPPGWLPNDRPNTVRVPGWYDQGQWYEDETQVGSNTGNVAWAMLALLYFYETTHEQEYKTAVERLGRWVISNTWDTGDIGGHLGGFTAGYTGWETGASSGTTTNCASNTYVNGQCKRLYKATEHNIDLYSAFSRLFLLDHRREWQQAAEHAKAFFLRMWDPNDGKFWTGTMEDGQTISTDPIPLDIQVWAIEALGSEAQGYTAALNYIEAHHKTTYGYGFKQNDDDPLCGDHTWFEGTSQVALAYLLTGSSAKWQSILDVVHSQQWGSGAMPATDGACLDTGFTLDDGKPWEYFPRAHVGATAWLSLAENQFNPFRANLYSSRGPSGKSGARPVAGF